MSQDNIDRIEEPGTLTAERYRFSESDDTRTAIRPKRSTVKGDRFKEHQMSLILFMVTLVLFLLTTPHFIIDAVYIFVDCYSSAEVYATYTLLFHITGKLYFTNSAVNFYLYLVHSAQFRKDLSQAFKVFCTRR